MINEVGLYDLDPRLVYRKRPLTTQTTLSSLVFIMVIGPIVNYEYDYRQNWTTQSPVTNKSKL